MYTIYNVVRIFYNLYYLRIYFFFGPEHIPIWCINCIQHKCAPVLYSSSNAVQHKYSPTLHYIN